MSVAIGLSVVGLPFYFVFVFYLSLINRHAECEYMMNKDIWTLPLVSTSYIAGSAVQAFQILDAVRTQGILGDKCGWREQWTLYGCIWNQSGNISLTNTSSWYWTTVQNKSIRSIIWIHLLNQNFFNRTCTLRGLYCRETGGLRSISPMFIVIRCVQSA